MRQEKIKSFLLFSQKCELNNNENYKILQLILLKCIFTPLFV